MTEERSSSPLPRFMVAVLLFLGSPSALHAQTDEDRREFFRPTLRWWSLDLDVAGVFNDNIDQDNDRKRRSQGVVTGVVTRIKDRRGRHRFSLRYGAGAQFYSRSDRADGAVSDLEATFERRLGSRLVVGAEGEHTFRVSSEDNELTNQFAASPFIERHWSSTRLAGYGGYRFKRVAESRADESIRLLGAELTQELGDAQVIGLGYRYEMSDSSVSSRRYTRSTYAADYTARLGARDRLRLELELREQRFLQRLVRINGARVPRVDYRWIPSAFWVHDFQAGHQFRFGYQFERRTSNDPTKDFQAHRVELGVRVALSGRAFREDPRPLLKRGGSLRGVGRSAARSSSIVLDQVRLLAGNAEYGPRNGHSFMRGSSWKDVLQAQGVPSNISERPAFFEELWFYGSSWVVLKDGRVTSWHDAGNLSLAPSPQERSSSVAGSAPAQVFQRVPYRMPTLAEIAAEQKANRAARANGSSEAIPASTSERPAEEVATRDDSISAVLQRVRQPLVVFKDGTRMEGVLQKYEKGLAYIILTRGPQGKSILTTAPEHLIDKEATEEAALDKQASKNPR